MEITGTTKKIGRLTSKHLHWQELPGKSTLQGNSIGLVHTLTKVYKHKHKHKHKKNMLRVNQGYMSISIRKWKKFHCLCLCLLLCLCNPGSHIFFLCLCLCLCVCLCQRVNWPLRYWSSTSLSHAPIFESATRTKYEWNSLEKHTHIYQLISVITSN